MGGCGRAMSGARSKPDTPAYFDAMFDSNDDPWGYANRWYEERKRALTLACLPARRYGLGYEPGCANGELSAALAARCDHLLASDGVDRAVELARMRLRDAFNVEVFKAWVPDDWPDRQFDLVVLSEFLFYVTPKALDRIVEKVVDTLASDGVVLACHWRLPIKDCVLNGDSVHARLAELLPLPNVCSVLQPECLLDVWTKAPTAATLDGLA